MVFKRLTEMATVGVLAFGVAATAGAAPQGVTDDEIRFGMHTALSGPAAAWGVGSVNGIRMRFEEANEKGGVHGRKLDLIVEDHQYQVPKAVQAANKLINRDKVFAMMGALGTPMNNAVMPRMFQNNIPNLFPYTSARSMGYPAHPLKFAAGSTYYDHNRIGTKYAVEELGAEKVCAMAQETDFGEETMDAVNDQLEAMDMKLVASTRHKPTDTDFVTAITELRNAGCDAVILGTILKDTILINGTAKKMGWDVPMIGNIASYDSIVSGVEGGVTEDYYAVTGFNIVYEDSAKGEAKAWIDRYKQRYGESPSAPSQLGYMIGDLLVTALDKAGKDLTVESLTTALESISSYQDIFGGPTLSFGPDKHVGSTQAIVAQVKNGRWQPLTDSVEY